MSKMFEDRIEPLRADIVKMEPKVVPTPSILTRSPFNDDFVRLQEKVYPSLGLSEKYMEREIEKVKHKGMKIDNYILHTKMYDKSVQFYKYVIGPRKTTYMTAPHFTLGLQGNRDGYEHVIKNEALYTPVHVFVCTGEKAAKYREHTNQLKALVEEKWVEDDFEVQPVNGNTEYAISKNSVYFVYTFTHSKFTLERRESRRNDNWSSSSMDNHLAATPPGFSPSIQPTEETASINMSIRSTGTPKKANNETSMRDIPEMEKTTETKDTEMDSLKEKNENQAMEIESLKSEVAELKAKLDRVKKHVEAIQQEF